MTKTSARPSAPPSEKKQTVRDFHEEERLGRAYDAAMLRRLWPFLRPHARYLWLSLGMVLLTAAFNLARPLVMGRVVDVAFDPSKGSLFQAGMALTLLVIFVQTLMFIQMYTMQIAGARAMADLRAHIFDFLQRLRLRFYDRTPVGRLVTRATNDVDALSELFASGVLNALGDLVALVGIVIMMLVLDVTLSLIAFAALPIVALIVSFVRSRARQAYREIRTRTARLNSFLNEQVSGMSVVQAYAREQAMASEFDGINSEYRDANKRSIFYEAVLDAAIEMVGTVCIASILWWAGLRRVDHPGLTFALLVTFTQYIKQFFEPVSLLAQRYTVLQSAMSGAERIFALLDENDVETEGGVGASSPSPSDASSAVIEMQNVTFGYKPETPVLHSVSLTVAKGERIALVGATGAGKSTLTSLLLRLYEHQSGEVRIFGRPLSAWDKAGLRSRFSVVPQDVFLFSGTVASNVALEDENVDMGRVADALSRVGAREIFEAREGGLLARVDERGANFSAGERQLLAFARAIYKDASILILDEATANIDSDTEARLQSALEAVMEGRTALIIAHRLSTIRAVDRIVVFHRGRIVETGTHDELLLANGVYSRLYRLQFAIEAQRSKGAGGEVA